MTELVGQITYDISLETSKLVNAQRDLERRLATIGGYGDRLQTKFTAVAAGISAALSAIAVEGLTSKLIAVQRQFDVMFSSLKTVTGGVTTASQAWERLTKFAAETPYSLDQSVQGFVKLKALGLDPSDRAMRSFGNTASAMGKDLTQMIEAVADASTGEFERLKEFGIKSKTEGDKIAFTFQGVTTRVKNNASNITDYLMKIGEVNFSGAMADRMNTLDGDISNLEDSITQLHLSISKSGFGDAIRVAAQTATKAIQDLTLSVQDGELLGYFAKLKPAMAAIEVVGMTLAAVMSARLAVAFVEVGARLAMATVSFGLATTSASVFGAALTALGGPFGVAVAGVTLLIMNWDKLGLSSKNAADIATDSASRIAAALKKSTTGADKDLTAQLAETDQAIKKLKESRGREKAGYTGPASDDVIREIDDKIAVYEEARKNIRAAMNTLGGGPGRGSVNPSSVVPESEEDKRKAAEGFKYLAQLRIKTTQDALKQIDLEEKAALADNEARIADGSIFERDGQQARLLIAQQFAAKRREVAEKDAESAAAARIAMTVDEEQKIIAVRDEAIRKASVLESMGVITHKEAERQKRVASFESTQQLAALNERVAQTHADTNIAATLNELTKIDMIRQEAFRRADAAERLGTMTHKQAEEEKRKASVDAQNAIRQQLNNINPVAALKNEYDQKMAIVDAYEKILADKQIDAEGFVQQKRAEINRQYLQQRQQLAEAEFSQQSASNKFLVDSLNAMASTATTSITGLIKGTMTAQDAMRGLANTVLDQAVGALVQVGMQYIKNALIAQSASAATTAAQTAAIATTTGAQVAATGTMAATSVAASETVAVAAAPAAGLMSVATLGKAALIGAAALIGTMAIVRSLSGNRQYGGPVSAGGLYRVNEAGAPEMFTASNGQQYMMPTASGSVTAADKVGGGVTVYEFRVINQFPAASVSQRMGSDGRPELIIAEVARQISENSGPVWSALRSSSNVQSRL